MLSFYVISLKIVWRCLGKLNDQNTVTQFEPGKQQHKGNEIADSFTRKEAVCTLAVL